MQIGWSYVKDSSDFKNKIKKLGKLSGNITLERLVKCEDLKLPFNDIVKIAEFVLKNNIFEFNGKVKRQLAGTAIGTKFAPPYAGIYMDEVATEFLKMQELQPLVWFRYIDDIFFIRNHSEDELNKFLENLNKSKSNLKFTYEISKDNINLLMPSGNKKVTHT